MSHVPARRAVTVEPFTWHDAAPETTEYVTDPPPEPPSADRVAVSSFGVGAYVIVTVDEDTVRAACDALPIVKVDAEYVMV